MRGRAVEGHCISDTELEVLKCATVLSQVVRSTCCAPKATHSLPIVLSCKAATSCALQTGLPRATVQWLDIDPMTTVTAASFASHEVEIR